MAYPSPPKMLESVVYRIHLPGALGVPTWRVEATGASSQTRGSLWSRSWSWPVHEAPHGLEVMDQINWHGHAVLQDRPSSPFWLDRSERGLPVGVQGVLFD